jgi:hypothetical protein
VPKTHGCHSLHIIWLGIQGLLWFEQGHNGPCTEDFSKRHVEEEMRLRSAEQHEDKDARRIVVEALKKWRGGDAPSGADDTDDGEVDTIAKSHLSGR